MAVGCFRSHIVAGPGRLFFAPCAERPMNRRARVLLVCAALATTVRVAQAQDSVPPKADTLKRYALPPVTVTGHADHLADTATTASQGHVGAADLRSRPMTREGELQEVVPGMIVTQHSGDGKANQYFVRGFNLDHGTDFQTSVDGIPLNMPTHAHGQGYTDLNFLIPELIDHIDYQVGVYYTRIGDFGSAGAAQYSLVRSLPRPFMTASAGAYGMARLATGGSARVGDGDMLLGGEVKGYSGPWTIPERLRKLSGVARYSFGHGASAFSVLAMAYHNQWHASDQIPLRAVQSGLIGRFGQIDSTDGGSTARYSLSGSWRHAGPAAVQQVELFAVHSDLSLFSDFEYRLTDTTRGDQFNQLEHRLILGGKATDALQVEVFGVANVLTVGVETRGDMLTPVGLYHTEARVRLGTVRQDEVHEWGTGAFVETESRWRPWLRTVFGCRVDLYSFDVTSDLPANSGHRTAGIASPKASLVFTPWPKTDLYLSGGFGFHSNDARGTTITIDPGTGLPAQRVDPLVRSRGAELGVRMTPVRSWQSTLAVWVLNLDSELLFTGDGGTTEPSAASRRRGLTWINVYRPIPRLTLDADVSFSRARFAGVPAGQDYIPGALENVVAAGITWSPRESGVFGSVRVRHFGSYPLIEDNSVRAMPASLVNAEVGYLRGRTRLQVSVLNLLNEVGDDIEYYYGSRLAGEAPAGVVDIHFHPVEPRQIRIMLEWGA